jgi:hypothetical protein
VNSTVLGAGTAPDVAANATGVTAVSWIGTRDGAPVARVAVRAAGDASTFSTPVDLGDPTTAFWPSTRVAVSAAGDVVVTWTGYDGGLWLRVLRADGTRSSTTQLSSVFAADVTLTAAGNRVLALWVDKVSDGAVGGDLRSATIGPDGPVAGTPQTIGAGDRAVGTFGAARVATRSDGHVLIVWSAIRVTSEHSGQGVGNVVQEGDLDDGPLDPAAQQLPRDSFGGQLSEVPDAALLADDGRAVIVYDGLRVSLRPAGATAFPLPIATACRGARAIAAGFEGARILLGEHPGSLAPTRSVLVNHDGAPAPARCVQSPFVTQTPYQPAVGEDTTFNLSAYRDPDGVLTTWSWDLDADGTTDLGPGEYPVVHQTYVTPGDKHIIATITVHDPRGADHTSVHDYRFNVLDNRPRLPAGFGQPSTRATPPAASKLEVRSSLPLSRLRATGLRIRVRSPRAGSMQAAVSRNAITLARVTRKIAGSTTLAVTLRPKLSRALRRKKSFALALRVTVPGGKALRRTIRVNR